MRHVTGLHEADAFRGNRLSRMWKMPAVLAWTGVTGVLIVGGTVLTAATHTDHNPWVFDASDIVNHASAACLLVTMVILYRANRALLRGMDAANKAAGLPGPGEPAEMDRKAA